MMIQDVNKIIETVEQQEELTPEEDEKLDLIANIILDRFFDDYKKGNLKKF